MSLYGEKERELKQHKADDVERSGAAVDGGFALAGLGMVGVDVLLRRPMCKMQGSTRRPSVTTNGIITSRPQTPMPMLRTMHEKSNI